MNLGKIFERKKLENLKYGKISIFNIIIILRFKKNTRCLQLCLKRQKVIYFKTILFN